MSTEIYSVNLRIQSEYGKIRIRKNSVFEYFYRSDYINTCTISFSYQHIYQGKLLIDSF